MYTSYQTYCLCVLKGVVFSPLCSVQAAVVSGKRRAVTLHCHRLPDGGAAVRGNTWYTCLRDMRWYMCDATPSVGNYVMLLALCGAFVLTF